MNTPLTAHDGSLRCHRCSSPHAMFEVTITSPTDSDSYWICQACEPDVRVGLAPFDRPLFDIEDVDDAEHHAMCRCAECDPDYLLDMYRESRWDAERHTSIRLAS